MNNQSWLQNPKYALVLKKKAKMVIVLSQGASNDSTPSLCILGFYVFKKPSGTSFSSTLFFSHLFFFSTLDAFIFSRKFLVGKSEFSESREVHCELTLQPNVYVIIPTTFQPGQEGKFQIHLFGSREFRCVQVPNPKGSESGRAGGE